MDAGGSGEYPRQDTFIPRRHWEHTKLEALLQRGEQMLRPDQMAFTIVSYNILAQVGNCIPVDNPNIESDCISFQDLLNSHPELYQDVPGAHLRWKTRKANILSEIANLRPDILCLQEIQTDHLEGFTAELTRRCTFDRVFKKRTGIEKTDGCAIFFNPDVFELVDQRTIEFNQQVNLLDRDNIGIAIKLRSRKNPEAVFIVATTHLLFNPRRLDIKLAQVHVLLAELEQLAFNRNHQQDRYYPIILTGDFNMEPTSTPYSLITNGRINYQDLPQEQPIISDDLGITDTCQHIHSLKYGREKDQSQVLCFSQTTTLFSHRPTLIKFAFQLIHSERSEAEKRKMDVNSGYENMFNTGYLSHPLHLTSTYRNFEERSSTHHHDWITVDYLFYSRYFNSKFKRVCEGSLKLLSYLELPLTAECIRMERMPNEVIGSDHFSLAARFLLGNS